MCLSAENRQLFCCQSPKFAAISTHEIERIRNGIVIEDKAVKTGISGIATKAGQPPFRSFPFERSCHPLQMLDANTSSDQS